MSVINAATLGPIGQQGAQAPNRDAFADLDLQTFIKLMITELQNQDPLNPMDNAQILQQISQIREIQSNQRLTDTLEAVFLGQNLSSASGMIGDWVMKLGDTEEGKDIVQGIGPVDRVIVEDGVSKLSIDNRLVSLKGSPNIQVLSEDIGQEIKAIMDKINHEVVGMTSSTMQSPEREITGRITGVSLRDGDPQFARYVVTDDNGTKYLIDKDNLIEDLTAELIGAQDTANVTPLENTNP